MSYETAFLFLNMPAHFYAGIIIGLLCGLAGGYYLFSKSIRFYQDQIKHLKDELERSNVKNQRINDYFAQALTGLSQKKTAQQQADKKTNRNADN